ncbi:hypothetical protein DFO47_110169 [Arthrobacter sp. AG258]|uniref:hypothetical protein n=1 Tax=Arthrobacter sp. AG258 TaxID=2183899 RepID=UPI00105D8D29|nr:hypothetical protein [Arthrobacter sp. AG258]TDT75993.1 hypothetical protein DFO47_110169 [Arthrobacter sp. AG258]
MSSLFLWIIILSFVVPMAMRMYRRSMARRDRDQGLPGQYPDQFPGQYGPGGFPGSGRFPGSAGPQSNQPRDGYTQQDYYSGGFRQPRPANESHPQPYQYGQRPMPDPRYGAPQEPPFQQFPGQQFPGQQGMGQQGMGQQFPGQQQGTGHTPAGPPPGPAVPPPGAPQGFRARKLAELDQQYSNGEMSMEDYMKRRSDIMNG